MRYLGASVLLLAAACASTAEPDVSASPVTTESEITFAEMTAEIAAKNLATIDDMLEDFAHDEHFRPLLRNPVLEPKSFAIHGREVSAEYPRILLHQGRLTIQLLGDPANPKAQSMEVMEFMPGDKRFHYRVLNFAAKDTPNYIVEEAENAPFETMGPAYEGFSQCSECHSISSVEPRPRWPMAPIWQTPFGKVGERIAAGTQDMAEWQRFEGTLRDPAKGRRYRTLDFNASVTADGVTFPDHPNSTLSRHMAGLNRKRVGRIITTWPGFAQHELAVVGAMLGCDDFEGFLPDDEHATRRDKVLAFLRTKPREVTPTVARAHVDPAKLAPILADDQFGFRAVHGRPDMVQLGDLEFLEITTLPILPALEELVRGTGESTMAQMFERDDTQFDLRGFVWKGRDYSSATFPELTASLRTDDDVDYPALAKLRYLMEDTVAEQPLHWSASVPYSFGVTYRFGDGDGGLSRILADEIGPRFLADHPELDSFAGHVVAADRLTDRAGYCATLRARSHTRN